MTDDIGTQRLGQVRTFDSGATRDLNTGKLDYYRFFSPRVLRRYAEYMHQHRRQPDGTMRDGDNWKKGIPIEAYRESLSRHFHEYFQLVESAPVAVNQFAQHDTLCAILFNVMGILFEETRPLVIRESLPDEPPYPGKIIFTETLNAVGRREIDPIEPFPYTEQFLPEPGKIIPFYLCADPHCVNRVLEPNLVCPGCMRKNFEGGHP